MPQAIPDGTVDRQPQSPEDENIKHKRGSTSVTTDDSFEANNAIRRRLFPLEICTIMTRVRGIRICKHGIISDLPEQEALHDTTWMGGNAD